VFTCERHVRGTWRHMTVFLGAISLYDGLQRYSLSPYPECSFIQTHSCRRPLRTRRRRTGPISVVKAQAAPLKNVNRRNFAASFVFDPSLLMRLIGAVC